jgi:hypothetical protein
MALQPSRPGFMIAGALVFLVLPFLWAEVTKASLDIRLVATGAAVALLFLALAVRYRRQLRDSRAV